MSLSGTSRRSAWRRGPRCVPFSWKWNALTLNLIHELSERRIGVRNLADPIRVDSSRPEDPMAQLAAVLLALFAQMERTHTIERAAHARAVASAKARRVGRPVLVDPGKLESAAHFARARSYDRRDRGEDGDRPHEPVPASADAGRLAAYAQREPTHREHAWRIDHHANYGPLGDLARHRVNTGLICEQWEDILRVAGSLSTGTVRASELLRVLQGGARPAAPAASAARSPSCVPPGTRSPRGPPAALTAAARAHQDARPLPLHLPHELAHRHRRQLHELGQAA
jgi:hypothetical protein